MAVTTRSRTRRVSSPRRGVFPSNSDTLKSRRSVSPSRRDVSPHRNFSPNRKASPHRNVSPRRSVSPHQKVSPSRHVSLSRNVTSRRGKASTNRRSSPVSTAPLTSTPPSSLPFGAWLGRLVGRGDSVKPHSSKTPERRVEFRSSDDDLEVSSTSEEALFSDSSEESESETTLRSASKSTSTRSASKHNAPKSGSYGSSPQKKQTKSGAARRPRGIKECDRKMLHKMISKDDDPAIIINAANYRPTKRRPRLPWTPSEVMFLRMGVERFGMAWADILKCNEYKFHPHRVQIDLKDKWRNLTNYRPYGSHGKRTFVLLDADHNTIVRPDTLKPYRFNNRWPRDAALKAASKTEFYDVGRTHTTIRVREILPDENASSVLVHVYEGTRKRCTAPPHLNELRIRQVWQSDVRKTHEERHVSKADLVQIEQDACRL
ncbi:hypothetical protein PSACC_03617 [Paramicrosporidium saccamoebae]|uniref:Myb-like domain-containing protein n=1 Tax=Paramicrosporidium saccamoebae TaxID=1246581 RepID=A0A2H9TFK2_9FUNG|nr:hypothetical protein PSACC_03617 [Paramicrosporidium saccamoebae]